MKTALFFLLVVTVLWIGVSGADPKVPTPEEATNTKKKQCLDNAILEIEALKKIDPKADKAAVCLKYSASEKCYTDITETKVTEATIFSELKIFKELFVGFTCYPLCDDKETVSCRNALEIKKDTPNQDCLTTRNAFEACLNKVDAKCPEDLMKKELALMETYLIEQGKPYCGQCKKVDEVDGCQAKAVLVDPKGTDCTKYNDARKCFVEKAECTSVAIEFHFLEHASPVNVAKDCQGCMKGKGFETRLNAVKELIKTPKKNLEYCKKVKEDLSKECDKTKVDKEIEDLQAFAETLDGKLTCTSSASLTQVSLVAILTSMLWITSRLF